jgi:hypothetical protein
MGKETMDNGRIVAAVVGGYLLGRTKKMKLAIMVGGALMGKKIPTDPAALLKLAGSVVDKSPELQRLDTAVRGRLMEAGKDAALSVASSRMESLTDSLVNRVENFGRPTSDDAVPQGADGEIVDAEIVDGAEDTDEQASEASETSSARNGSSTRHGSSARNGSTARNGSRTRNASSTRNGSTARNGSGRSTRRTEAVHD